MQPAVTLFLMYMTCGVTSIAVLMVRLRFVALQLIFTDHLDTQLISEDLWLQCVREVLIFQRIFSDCCSQPSCPRGSWL